FKLFSLTGDLTGQESVDMNLVDISPNAMSFFTKSSLIAWIGVSLIKEEKRSLEGEDLSPQTWATAGNGVSLNRLINALITGRGCHKVELNC
ncbi:MAG: hypothetical protein KKD85_04935, partial [Proteobacteria bacterium]|nr:hypothetical protein [Pseudomonadota bacterium]